MPITATHAHITILSRLKLPVTGARQVCCTFTLQSLLCSVQWKSWSKWLQSNRKQRQYWELWRRDDEFNFIFRTFRAMVDGRCSMMMTMMVCRALPWTIDYFTINFTFSVAIAAATVANSFKYFCCCCCCGYCCNVTDETRELYYVIASYWERVDHFRALLSSSLSCVNLDGVEKCLDETDL